MSKKGKQKDKRYTFLNGQEILSHNMLAKAAKKKREGNFLKFLGTAGARFVVMKQLRASGGLWVSLEGINLLIDPGPGSLVKCNTCRPRLEPRKLDGIFLTHRHLDHSNDVNVMVEAMTEGGFKKRGVLFLPEDAIKKEPIVLKYIQEEVERVEILKEGKDYPLGDIKLSTPLPHLHGVQTFGLNIEGDRHTISLISDTRYFDGLLKVYKGDILIINVVLLEPKPGLDHLSLSDCEKIINKLKPQVSILTHFGMGMIRAKPHQLAEELSGKLGLKVLVAYDGMRFELNEATT